MTENVCILVTGMHRSGTSAVTRVISLLGAGLPTGLLPAGEGNQAGFWESADIVELNNHLMAEAGSGWDDWRRFDIGALPADAIERCRREAADVISRTFAGTGLIVLKDPRISRLLPVYLDALSDVDAAAHVVLMNRNPLAVARSLAARNKFSVPFGAMLWLRYMLDAEQGSRPVPRTIVRYEDLIADGPATAARLTREIGALHALGREVIPDEIASFISSGLQHQQADASELAAAPDVPDVVGEAYALFEALADKDNAANRKRIDELRQRFDGEMRQAGNVAMGEIYERQREYSNLHTYVSDRLKERESELRSLRGSLGHARRELKTLNLESAKVQEFRLNEHSKSTRIMQKLLESEKRAIALAEEKSGLEIQLEEGRAETGRLNLELQQIRAELARLTGQPWRRIGPVLRRGLGSVSRAATRTAGTVRAIRYLGLRTSFTRARQIVEDEGPAALLRKVRTVSDRLHPVGAEGVSVWHPGPPELIDERAEFVVRLAGRAAPNRPADPSVLILSDTQLPQCWKYRIENKLETFRLNGIRAEAGDPGDLYKFLSELQNYRSLMFYRMPMSDLFMIYHDEARRLGLNIFYDLDDPTFDRVALGSNANLNMIDPVHRTMQLRDAPKFRQAMESADHLLASTPELAALMSAAAGKKPASLWRNVVDQAGIRLSGQILAEPPRRHGQTVRIGYFSGSLAHEADFNEALPALVELLRDSHDIELMVAGHAEPRAELRPFAHRMRTVGFSDYESYLREVAQCDLVLVPLVDNAFNRCKSIVRYLDAALVEVPVVASAVGDYSLIDNGKTGWAIQRNEWLPVLSKLVEDRKLREHVGKSARKFVLKTFTTAQRPPDFARNIREEFFGKSHAAA